MKSARPSTNSLENRHYLASARLAGQTLRYVAELDGQWVALLTFSAAALHLKAREAWLGWTPRQRARRLGLVVNNSRFLVLPERQRYPNLASRVLGLILRRLIADWQEHWAHPVLVVESFVDEAHYCGTCYRACGSDRTQLESAFAAHVAQEVMSRWSWTIEELHTEVGRLDDVFRAITRPDTARDAGAAALGAAA